jgi:hypothetical protein
MRYRWEVAHLPYLGAFIGRQMRHDAESKLLLFCTIISYVDIADRSHGRILENIIEMFTEYLFG